MPRSKIADKVVRKSFRLPEDLVDLLQGEADYKGIDLSAYVREILDCYTVEYVLSRRDDTDPRTTG